MALQKPTRPTNEQLSDLYPVAKTYDEIEAENTERQQRIAARAPQHITATTAGRLLAAYVLGGLVLFVIPDLAMTGSLYGVALSFLFGIVWLWVAMMLVRQITRDQYALAISSQSFFAAYVVCLTVPFAVASLFIHPEGTQSVLAVLGAASIWHCIATWIALKLAIRVSANQIVSK